VSVADKYVVAVYAVIWVVLLLYVILLAARTQRVARELELIARVVEQKGGPQ
jgi:CcmD family protein